jgi:hypothetical protein
VNCQSPKHCNRCNLWDSSVASTSEGGDDVVLILQLELLRQGMVKSDAVRALRQSSDLSNDLSDVKLPKCTLEILVWFPGWKSH